MENVVIASDSLQILLYCGFNGSLANFTGKFKKKNLKKMFAYPLIKLAQNSVCLYFQLEKNIKKIQYLYNVLWKFNRKIQYNFPIKITC